MVGRVSVVAVAALMLAFEARAEEPKPPHPVFGINRVHRWHLELSAKEFAKLQAVKGGFAFGNRTGTVPPIDPPDEVIERHKSGGGFGMEFPWVRATLTAEGKTLNGIGLRFKGNGSYLPTAGKLKRNLKVDLDHYDDSLRFNGLKTINLNAGAVDPTRVREALAYAAYREAGVPAPRTAFAEVSLSVPGKYEGELVGLYTVVEQLDKAFLNENFGNSGGLLMKPERMREFDYLGEDWERYKSRYLPKGDPTPKQIRRVIDFARLVHQADDATFAREVSSFLDMDSFLRFYAVTAMIANMDNLFFTGHNYCLYLRPDTDKFAFIPWDVDLAFAGFPFLTTSDQQMNLSLVKPYGGTHRLADRIMAIKEIAVRYQQIVREIATKSFKKEMLLARLATVEAATREPLEREAKAVAARKEPATPNFFTNTPDIRTFVEKRLASIEAQLSGTSKGFIPPGNLSAPPAGGPRPGGGAASAAFLTTPMIDALDKNKDRKLSREELIAGATRFFKEGDMDKKGWLDEKSTADQINRIFPLPAGFGNPGAPGGDRFAGGFGPGNFMAGPLVRKADGDKDGKVTLAELTALVATTFQQVDKAKSEALDEKQLAEGLRMLFPPPPGMGAPPAPAAPMKTSQGEKKP